MDEKLRFGIYDSTAKVVPTFVEKDTNRPYLSYGNDNRFPQYLWDLYLRSALLQSIIEGTAGYALGNGINYNENTVVQKLSETANKDGETLEDIIKKVTVDYLIFGGFALQVINNKLGEISEIYWLDFRNVRLNKEGDKAFYSEDWVRHANDYVTYDIYDPNVKQKSGVFYFKGHVSRGVYPVPRYNGALSAIETSTEISKFHLNSILNNFSGNFIINFNNGAPSTEVQEEIERKVKAKFGGAENAGKFLIAFNDSKENGVSVERIQDDNFDKKYENLRIDTYKEIFIAFRAIPQIFGLSTEGTGFNKQEFDEAFLLYNRTTVVPIQRDLQRVFDRIFGVKESINFIPFSLETNA